jgi:hypothetical protein
MPSTITDAAWAQIALTADAERLFYPEPDAQSVVEVRTQTDSFKGPDIALPSRPGALVITPGTSDPYLWSAIAPPAELHLFALPPNGAKPDISTQDLALAGCEGPARFIAAGSAIYLTCHDSATLLTLDDQSFSPYRLLDLTDSGHPTHVQVQHCEEVGR